MSLLENGKLRGWNHHCGHEKIKLHPQTEEAQLKLYKLIDERFKESMLKEEAGMAQLEYLLKMGPKKLYKMGAISGAGWRRGYTK